jgi:hypothetical protein
LLVNRAVEAAQKERPAVTYAAIDLHKKESQIQILTAEGEVIDIRMATRARP